MNFPTAGRRPQIRLLHLDDDPWFRSLMKAALELNGAWCDVMPAESGRDAIVALGDCLRSGTMVPDLLLLDLRLGDGLEVLHFAKSHAALATIPAVILAAELPPEAEDAARRLGAAACWVKPRNGERLRELAGRLLALLHPAPVAGTP